MRNMLTAFALWALGTVGAFAQVSSTSILQTGVDAQGWEAVGRLDIDGEAFCTGALIAPDLVLTAAHCLFDRDTGTLIDATRIQFLAGFRNGRALAYRNVRRAVTPEQYSFDARSDNFSTRFDLALLELTLPIRLSHIEPFTTASAVHAGEQVGVVSYAHNRADAPTLQQVCDVLGTDNGVIVISCAVDFGSSGSPIFHIQDGVARIVSVVSAKAEVDGEPVALGTTLLSPLTELRDRLASTDGVLAAPGSGSIRVITPGQRSETGPYFVDVDDH